MDVLNPACLLSSTLTFPPHPGLSSGPQCPPASRQRGREVGVGPAHAPHSGHQAARSCWGHLHLPRFLQHVQPLCLLKLGLRCQQDVPLPGRGATMYLGEGRSEDMEAVPRPLQSPLRCPALSPCGPGTPPRYSHWRGYPQRPLAEPRLMGELYSHGSPGGRFSWHRACWALPSPLPGSPLEG